mmetsp:Transcript_22081/g.51054  ORF Transcript_22081/g.51054 Transcript_22081/m.51054 type:complete len:117 (-) Transcript_22081:1837-2187(-)
MPAWYLLPLTILQVILQLILTPLPITDRCTWTAARSPDTSLDVLLHVVRPEMLRTTVMGASSYLRMAGPELTTQEQLVAAFLEVLERCLVEAHGRWHSSPKITWRIPARGPAGMHD